MRGLNPVSLKVYETIVRRFLAIFYEPAIYKKVSLTMGMETERFFASFKAVSYTHLIFRTWIYQSGRQADSVKKRISGLLSCIE